MEDDSTEHRWRHALQFSRAIGQTEQLNFQLTFDTIEQAQELIAEIDELVVEPRQKKLEEKMEEINRKIRESQEGK